MPENLVIVVPCFNEEHRFQPERFQPMLGHEGLVLLLVNDGSTDGTLAMLQALAGNCQGCCQVLTLARNGGKAEAVRRGLEWAVAHGARVAGYLDADGATSAEEMLRLAAVLEHEHKEVVLAARVALAGYRIERRPMRHYVGRLFATCAALVLGTPVYDTQCGAKVFRVTPALIDAIRRPFRGRWAFDVDLLGRLLHPESPGTEPCPADRWLEVPLKSWHDMAGSKMRLVAMLGMGWDLVRIFAALRRRMRRTAATPPRAP